MFRVLIDTEEYECMHDRLFIPKKMCLESRDIFKFREIDDNISLTMQERDTLQWKSYVACRMAPLPMLLNDVEGHFCCLKPLAYNFYSS